MRRTACRLFTPLLFLCLSGVAPKALPCDDSPHESVAVAVPVLSDFESSRLRTINNRGDIAGAAVRQSREPTEQAVVWWKHRRHGYRAEQLPALDGFLRGDARGFVTNDVPVGFAYSPGPNGGRRAVAWVRDRDTRQVVSLELEPPPGYTSAHAMGANGAGAIAGEAWNSGEIIDGAVLRHAVAWYVERRGGFSVCDLGVPDGYSTSAANAVATFGDVVGTATRYDTDGRPIVDVFVWRPSGRRGVACRYTALPLPSAPGLTYNRFPDINWRGDVVATARSLSAAGAYALYWRRVGRHYAAPEILPLPEGFTESEAYAINARGEIVGTVQQRSPTAQTRAILWTPRPRRGWRAILLDNPGEVTALVGRGINDNGAIIAETPSGASPAGAYVISKTHRAPCHSIRHACPGHAHHHGRCGAGR